MYLFIIKVLPIFKRVTSKTLYFYNSLQIYNKFFTICKKTEKYQ